MVRERKLLQTCGDKHIAELRKKKTSANGEPQQPWYLIKNGAAAWIRLRVRSPSAADCEIDGRERLPPVGSHALGASTREYLTFSLRRVANDETYSTFLVHTPVQSIPSMKLSLNFGETNTTHLCQLDQYATTDSVGAMTWWYMEPTRLNVADKNRCRCLSSSRHLPRLQQKNAVFAVGRHK